MCSLRLPFGSSVLFRVCSGSSVISWSSFPVLVSLWCGITAVWISSLWTCVLGTVTLSSSGVWCLELQFCILPFFSVSYTNSTSYPSHCSSLRAFNFDSSLNTFFFRLWVFCDPQVLPPFIWRIICLLVPSIFGELKDITSRPRDYLKETIFFI